jgi:hypothetical protein
LGLWGFENLITSKQRSAPLKTRLLSFLPHFIPFHWTAKRTYILSVGAVSVSLLIIISFSLYRLRADAIEHAYVLADTYSRALEESVTQTLNLTVLLAAERDWYTRPDSGSDTQALDAGLAETIRHLPGVRSLSLVSNERVFASSNPRNKALQVNFSGYLPTCQRAGVLHAGTPWSGRDFADAPESRFFYTAIFPDNL